MKTINKFLIKSMLVGAGAISALLSVTGCDENSSSGVPPQNITIEEVVMTKSNIKDGSEPDVAQDQTYTTLKARIPKERITLESGIEEDCDYSTLNVNGEIKYGNTTKNVHFTRVVDEGDYVVAEVDLPGENGPGLYDVLSVTASINGREDRRLSTKKYNKDSFSESDEEGDNTLTDGVVYEDLLDTLDIARIKGNISEDAYNNLGSLINMIVEKDDPEEREVYIHTIGQLRWKKVLKSIKLTSTEFTADYEMPNNLSSYTDSSGDDNNRKDKYVKFKLDNKTGQKLKSGLTLTQLVSMYNYLNNSISKTTGNTFVKDLAMRRRIYSNDTAFDESDIDMTPGSFQISEFEWFSYDMTINLETKSGAPRQIHIITNPTQAQEDYITSQRALPINGRTKFFMTGKKIRDYAKGLPAKISEVREYS